MNHLSLLERDLTSPRSTSLEDFNTKFTTIK